VFKLSLGDLKQDDTHGFRTIRLKVEEVSGKNCLTNFNGMEFTSDKLRSMVKKWQTLINAFIDVKTTDGYLVRLFTIGFTKRRSNQVRKTTYAQSSQVRKIRKIMFEIMNREVSLVDLKGLVGTLVREVIEKEIEKACMPIFPLQNVFVRKVKILKSPKFDMQKLLELHSEDSTTATDLGAKVVRTGEFKEQVFANV
jgi:small subunit ribosomal protein S3Ae